MTSFGRYLEVERFQNFSTDFVLVEVDEVVEAADEVAEVVADLRRGDDLDVAAVTPASFDFDCGQRDLAGEEGGHFSVGI